LSAGANIGTNPAEDTAVGTEPVLNAVTCNLPPHRRELLFDASDVRGERDLLAGRFLQRRHQVFPARRGLFRVVPADDTERQFRAEFERFLRGVRHEVAVGVRVAGGELFCAREPRRELAQRL
jgi:hypothetical protein